MERRDLPSERVPSDKVVETRGISFFQHWKIIEADRSAGNFVKKKTENVHVSLIELHLSLSLCFFYLRYAFRTFL